MTNYVSLLSLLMAQLSCCRCQADFISSGLECMRCANAKQINVDSGLYVQTGITNCTPEVVTCNERENQCIIGHLLLQPSGVPTGYRYRFMVTGCHATTTVASGEPLVPLIEQTAEGRSPKPQPSNESTDSGNQCAQIFHVFNLGHRQLPGQLYFCICNESFCNDVEFFQSEQQKSVFLGSFGTLLKHGHAGNDGDNSNTDSFGGGNAFYKTQYSRSQMARESYLVDQMESLNDQDAQTSNNNNNNPLSLTVIIIAMTLGLSAVILGLAFVAIRLYCNRMHDYSQVNA